jgi:Zn finger protein HypA/HybF involved in hydrogenase expression
MPVTVGCSCGKKFSAPDNLVGKRVKCPGCGEPVQVASAKAGSAAAGAAAAAKVVATCGCGHQFKAPANLAGKAVKCPGCGEAVRVPGNKNAEGTKGSGAAPVGAGTIAARCDCGKTIAAKAELAGRAVKCPSCGKPLRVPGGKSASTTSEKVAKGAAAKSAGKSVPVGAAPRGGANPLADLLDEVGVEQTQTGARCPECKSDMDPEAVLCIKCGYHLEKKKKLDTIMPTQRAQSRFSFHGANDAKDKAKGGGTMPEEIAGVVKTLQDLAKYVIVIALIPTVIILVQHILSVGSDFNRIDYKWLGLVIGIIWGVAVVVAAISSSASSMVAKRTQTGRIIGLMAAGICFLTPWGIRLLKQLRSPELKGWCNR